MHTLPACRLGHDWVGCRGVIERDDEAVESQPYRDSTGWERPEDSV